MGTPVNEGLWSLTEKEKQTLRLIVRGHDAKSIARSLGLSVHTINERLRDARRKMAVSSSREAARLLLQAEGDHPGSPQPELLGDAGIGEDAIFPPADQGVTPISGAGQLHRRSGIVIGAILMALVLGLLALVALPEVGSEPPLPTPVTTTRPANMAVVDAARQWLVLLDQGRWDESYRATGAPFRKLNTPQMWAAASEQVRSPLGTTNSRTFASEENLPAPPRGYEVVKFQTSFANRAEAVETTTLDLEDGTWRVVGVTID